MRQIGTLPEEQALRFADYLLTLGITSRVEEADGGCAIWIHREDHLDRAREELAAFRDDPRASRYIEARRQAEDVRRHKEKLDREFARRTVDLRSRMGGVRPSLGPLTRGIMVAAIALFLVDWLVYHNSLFSPINRALLFTEWYPAPGGGITNDGLASIRNGQVWRLVTPALLHGNLLHLFFNMYMFVALGNILERRRGIAELAALWLVCAVVSDVAQYLLPDLFTVPMARGGGDGPFLGMSGVVYGLFGYAWMRGRYDPASGMVLHPQTVMMLLIWLVICAFNLLGPIANTAHVAGLVAGIAFAFASMARDGVFR